MLNRPVPLETLSITVAEAALEAFEAAFSSVCLAVGFFRDEDSGDWRVEGIKPVGAHEPELAAALALAEALTGETAAVLRTPVDTGDWVARSYAGFPEQRIGRRFRIRGTHISAPPDRTGITLTLDASRAFGTGEHGSTRGCLLALEIAARRRPRRILDLGTGSAILAMAAAKLLHRRVLGTDIEPVAVRLARENTILNQVAPLVRVRLADGWRSPVVRAGGPYDLVLANILARPLCLMAGDLARNLSPGGTVILSGLLLRQRNSVLAAHRRFGLRLQQVIPQERWATIMLRKPGMARKADMPRKAG